MYRSTSVLFTVAALVSLAQVAGAQNLHLDATQANPSEPRVMANRSEDTLSVKQQSPTPQRSSIEVAGLEWSQQVDAATTVLIATTATPADALTSGVLQGSYEAPLLFADPKRGLNVATLAEIRRLGAKQAFILGGPASVPLAVEHQLDGLAVKRLHGPTRIETALAVAQVVSSPTDPFTGLAKATSSAPQGALLIRSLDPTNASDPTAEFGDALGAGALAAQTKQVVLLTPTNELNAGVKDYLKTYPALPVHIVGGPQAINDHVVSEIPASHPKRRLSGASRAETAVELAQSSSIRPKGITVLDGFSKDSWAVGLAGARYTSAHSHALVVVHRDHTNTHVSQALQRLQLGSQLPVYLGRGITTLRARPGQVDRLPSPFVYIDLAAEADGMHHLNNARQARNLSPVTRHAALDASAQQWSQAMLKANKISHAPDWSAQIAQVIHANPQVGFGHPLAENVVIHPNVGSNTGRGMHDTWMGSRGHANNMLRTEAAYVGYGVVCDLNTCYGTQRFTTQR
ncbi:cell wall-binding repeat-containing protein [Stomatohabitans albus]|uniref:cell wall-binding repeat-containing protein n=1 Tax=Stomatohabitans albus TaxID=3110766 RepID=UPI00300DBA1F